LPAGHTASCVDDCRYVWTGGPARRDDLAYLGPFTPGGRGDGRPIWVTDIRNAAKPKVFPQPIDLGRNDGATDYSHDVDVDAQGIAWTSGRGGLLGYATKGKWRDPRSGHKRWATPWSPVLVAGGGIEGGPNGVAQPATDFIHNSDRPLGKGVRAAGVKRGNVAFVTEEDFTEPCDQGGRIVAVDITDSIGGGPAAASTPEAPYRMKALSAFHPTQDTPETTAPITECSAHYFETSGSSLAAAWYGQGLRLIDGSDARNLRQVGYYYVTGTDEVANPSSLAWDTAWRGNLVYVFDHARGIEVLRVKGGPHGSHRLPTADHGDRRRGTRRDRFAAKAVGPRDSLICPAFDVPGQTS
jgi:hypothetical protein